jgi:hypothetical protein
VGFIVTNLETDSRAVVRFYNKRGTAEQWIKEGKQAVKMTRLSCHRFRSNQVRLAQSLLACNLGNLWRRLALPKRIEDRRAAGETCALLLASPSGRTSEPAAVRSDAWPNRAAAGTDGIADAGQARIGLPAGWDKGRCCKNVAEHGQFALALVPIANRQGRSR